MRQTTPALKGKDLDRNITQQASSPCDVGFSLHSNPGSVAERPTG
jgi:hypothetical protein